MLPTILPLLLTLLILTPFAHSKEQTLTDLLAFKNQRPCAKNCFGDYYLYKLSAKIGCGQSPVTEECICRSDLKPAGDAWIKECVNEECDQNALDTTTATGIYDGYCNAAAAAKSGASTTGAAGNSASTSSSTSLSTVTSKSGPQLTQNSETSPAAAATTLATSASPKSNPQPTTATTSQATDAPAASSSSKNGGLSTGEMIGVIVAVVGVLVTAIGSWFGYRAMKNRKG